MYTYSNVGLAVKDDCASNLKLPAAQGSSGKDLRLAMGGQGGMPSSGQRRIVVFQDDSWEAES